MTDNQLKTLPEQQAHAWSLAPDDAKWIAQCMVAPFEWYAYADDPINGIGGGFDSPGSRLFRGQDLKLNDWRDTLQSREEAMTNKNEFKRENRYAVLKLKNLTEAEKVQVNEFLQAPRFNSALTECVVVESDWPIYEQVWGMVEKLWESENASDKQWTPEVGQECEYTCGKTEGCTWINCEFVGKLSSGSHVLFIDGDYKSYHPWQIRYRPIQSKADRYRDEQIKAMSEIDMDWGESGIETLGKYNAVILYDAGVRVLAPDERIGKRLTDEQIRILAQENIGDKGENRIELINAVQNTIFGESEDD